LRASASLLATGDAHAARYFMYRALENITHEQENGKGKNTLAISYSRRLAERIGVGASNIIEANFPEYSATDLSAFPSGQFDYVVSDQVLEHVEGDPQLVFDESYRVLKQGGLAVHTTVFIFPIHGYPSDFWRFSPAALRLLARKFSEIIAVGGFGNRAMWIIDLLGLDTVPVPDIKWHPLHIVATRNAKQWPIVTWIVAKK